MARSTSPNAGGIRRADGRRDGERPLRLGREIGTCSCEQLTRNSAAGVTGNEFWTQRQILWWVYRRIGISDAVQQTPGDDTAELECVLHHHGDAWGDDIGRSIQLGIRPEHIELTSDGNAASVRSIEPTGSETHLQLEAGDDIVVAVLGNRPKLTVGEPVSFTYDTANILLFDMETGIWLTDHQAR